MGYLDKLLLEWGVNPANLGYKYIKYAVRLCLVDDTYLQATTKRLYPDVAKRMHTTGAKVDRAIRHELYNAFEQMPKGMAHEIFGNVLDKKTGRVTNRVFLAVLAEMVNENEQKENKHGK